MSTTSIGRAVEDAVARHMARKGYEIIEKNWRTKWCEIDLIATKDKVVYFVEVKFRKNASYGEGVDYITAKKRKQLYFAAELWVVNNSWNGEQSLLIASVDGAKSTIRYIELD